MSMLLLPMSDYLHSVIDWQIKALYRFVLTDKASVKLLPWDFSDYFWEYFFIDFQPYFNEVFLRRHWNVSYRNKYNEYSFD